jgi:phosphoribosylamine-glycine ligase
MTILFVSREGKSLGLAMRCASEGYSIIFYTEDERAAFIGNGLVNKPIFSKHLLSQTEGCIASNVNQLLSETSPDLVVTDGEGMGKIADYIREQKLLVFGSCNWTDAISTTNEYAREVSKRVGIDRWKGEPGIRVECGFWWNGVQSLFPFLIYNEDRFMTDSLGPLIPSSSHISQSISMESKLIRDGIGKMERLLKKSKFHGLLSLSCLLTKGKLYGISFSTSTLFLSSLLELYKGSVTDLLLAVATGRKSDGEMTTDFALSLLLSIPPYPSHPSGYNRTVVKGISPSNLRHLYLIDMMKGEGDEYVSAGTGGELMRVVARGRDVGECKKRISKTISNLGIVDVQYRTDPTRRFQVDNEKLREWNYLI